MTRFSNMVGDGMEHMTDEDLRQAYNAAAKPNAYGDELLRRIHAADRDVFGMSAENARLRSRA